jgi:hypothetical protein
MIVSLGMLFITTVSMSDKSAVCSFGWATGVRVKTRTGTSPPRQLSALGPTQHPVQFISKDLFPGTKGLEDISIAEGQEYVEPCHPSALRLHDMALEAQK